MALEDTPARCGPTQAREKDIDAAVSIVRWKPIRKEWEPDPAKPFLVQVLRQAVFGCLVHREFLRYFRNSLALMCEVWLKRKNIDPLINTSKNFHVLQDEFFKVLAHINRGFELEVNADWRNGVGRLIDLWKSIEERAEPQWIDHREERRKGDPTSRFELTHEPRQDAADAFWVRMFKQGRKCKEELLGAAEAIDAQQAKFFFSSFHLDEHRTFTDTKVRVVRSAQEQWLHSTLSAKLGFPIRTDLLEETVASSIETLKAAQRIIAEANARLWLLRRFFNLSRRDWLYLLETLTGGHAALERLVGSVSATLIIGRDRKSFELTEEDAAELFKAFWDQDFRLPYAKAAAALRSLHQSLILSEEYRVYREASTILSGLQVQVSAGTRFKSFREASTMLQALDEKIWRVIQDNSLVSKAVQPGDLQHPVDTETRYAKLVEKLRALGVLELEIHRVIEEVFWQVTDTFSDLIRAYRVRTKKRLTEEERALVEALVSRLHLRRDERNFLAYASDYCYLGKELTCVPERGAAKASTAITFEKRTQKARQTHLIPPLWVRRELGQRCGRYGKLLAEIREEHAKRAFSKVKMIWNSTKLQITDLRIRDRIKPHTLYAIQITKAEPRKLRERWE